MNPRQAEAWDRLEFDLDVRLAFWLSLVVGADPRPRLALREAARAWCAEHGRPFHLHAPHPDQLVVLATTLAEAPTPGLHWIVADGPRAKVEEWDRAAGRMMLAMNERREAYRKSLDAGVVIEGQESLVRQLRVLAPDLFSVRAAVLEAGIDAPELEETEDLTGSYPELRMPGDAQRAEERVGRLRRKVGPGQERALLVALDRAAGTRHYEENISRAGVLAEEQLTLASRLHRERPEVAWTRVELARALYRRGSIGAKAGQWARGAAWLEESRTLIEALREELPKASVLDDLRARVGRWQWWVAEMQGRLEEACAFAREVVDWRREMVEESPLDVEGERRFLGLLIRLGGLLAQTGDPEETDDAAAFIEARARIGRRALEAPKVRAWVELGVKVRLREAEWCRARDPGQARALLEEAADLSRAWCAGWPGAPRLLAHAQTLLELAEDADSQGQGLLRQEVAEAVERLAQVAPLHPMLPVVRGGLALQLAREAVAAGEAQLALDQTKTLLSELRARSIGGSRALLRLLAELVDLRCKALDALGRGAETLELLELADEVLERSATMEPASLSDLTRLRRTREAQVRRLLPLDRPAEVLEATRRAVKAAELAVWHHPGHATVRPELFNTLRRSAAFALAAGDRRLSRQMLEEAAMVGRDLVGRGGGRRVPLSALEDVHKGARELALEDEDTRSADHHGKELRALADEAADWPTTVRRGSG